MKNLAMVFVLLTAGIYTFGQTIDSNTVPPSPLRAPQSTYVRPDKKERFNKYVKGTFGPEALISTVASAAVRQATKTPREWGRTSEGFGKRVADGFGRSLISKTITYGLDEALKLDSNYYKSSKTGFKSKFSNAVLSAVTARNTEGKRVIGVPQLVGTYTSHIVANETWMPGNRNYKDGLRSGSISIASRMGFNLLREFVFK